MKPKSYWENPKWYEERQAEIVADKDKGMSNVDLVKKYGISQNRILSIIKKYREVQKGIQNENKRR
jgi:Mor family transcriptional regulator